jgi:signal peptidase II
MRNQASKGKFRSGLRWWWVAAGVLVFDHLTKWLAKTYLMAYQPLFILPVFNLTLSYNKGAAFNFLSYGSGWQVWFLGAVAVIVSVCLLVWLWRLSVCEHWTSIALNLIIGGALGNLWDRVTQGQVTDFIQLHLSHFYWPAFNMADTAICVGAAMLFLKTFFNKK